MPLGFLNMAVVQYLNNICDQSHGPCGIVTVFPLSLMLLTEMISSSGLELKAIFPKKDIAQYHWILNTCLENKIKSKEKNALGGTVHV